MAKFEEPLEEEIEFNEVEELGQDEQQEPEAVEAVEEKPEVVIPDKYQGKSVEDIVKMHQEAEKLIGKQAQEVGEVRRLADELLKRQLEEKKAVETPKEDEDPALRYYEDPIGAVNDVVEKHPAIAEARQQAQSIKQQQVTQRLTQQFPNFNEVTQDPRFFEWIKASPVRTKLFTEAHSQFDYDSAVELLSTWNMINPSQPQQTSDPELVTESKKGTQKSLKAAAVDTGSPAPTSRKTYRRADLINLRLRDPARYEAMSDEIMAAYAEGRVK
jgi:cell fate (sporulation/competence/biofilm development) regulator YmcA (YheA/YmcA/DUF963 family)